MLARREGHLPPDPPGASVLHAGIINMEVGLGDPPLLILAHQPCALELRLAQSLPGLGPRHGVRPGLREGDVLLERLAERPEAVAALNGLRHKLPDPRPGILDQIDVTIKPEKGGASFPGVIRSAALHLGLQNALAQDRIL